MPYGGMPYGGPPGRLTAPGPARGARRLRQLVAWGLIGAGVLAALGFMAGIVTQAGPRTFTASQRQQITDWEYGARWRDLPAGAIFPASVSYPAPDALNDDASLTLAAQRVGIAKQASCASATDPAAAAVLDRDGCSAMLRATYVDTTDSFVLTVGAAVLPGSASAQAAAQVITKSGDSSGLGATVHTVPFKGTAAGLFTDKQRQLSGVVAQGTYVVLYTVGYADGRPKQHVVGDSYTDGEMTSAGTGVAGKVLSTLAASVPPPHCPAAGIPGC